MNMKNSQSAGGVVVGPDKRILVVKQFGRYLSYSLPKGHIEPGEDPLKTAIREVFEEGGILHPKLIKSLGSYERPNIYDPEETKTVFMFLFHTNQLELTSQDPDKDTQPLWATVEEAKNLLTHPKDKEFFESSYLITMVYNGFSCGRGV